jgi:pimeloyl-ACP methyl ester carboxylesterase
VSERLEFPPYSLWETRTGAGTPVALVHGLSGSARWWSRNVDALAEKHLVAAVDLVGFGRNRRLVPPSFGENASLLARWLATFGEPVHLVGHSMGGHFAIRVASEHPELVRSLVLVNAAGMPFRFDPLPHIRPLPRPPYGGPGIARVLLPDAMRAGPASIAVAGMRVVLADLRERMHAIRVPTLLVWGAGDPLVPVQYGEAMQREIPDSRLVVIPGAAHVAMWDAPEEFNRIVLSFFDEVETRPSSESHTPAFGWGIAGWTNGIAHRQSGPRRDVVLVHGLGMSSRYFSRLARALHARGFHPIAPDVPGFGESVNAPAAGPAEHAQMLASWADAQGIRDAVWIGHSIGCNTVAHLARVRPDLVRRSIMIGPLWTRTRFVSLRTFMMLALDALREPLSLYKFVLPAYWRVGFARWWMTWRRYAADVLTDPPADAVFIAGERDPIPDRTRVEITHVPGAHACIVSHPEDVVDALERRRPAG